MTSIIFTILIGLLFIYIAIRYNIEPMLLLPLGFGIILVNIPGSSVGSILNYLFSIGLGEYELFPLLLFIGIGAMIDFTPLLSNPKLGLIGLFSQTGIFITIQLAWLLGFDLKDAISIGAIGTADGPTSLVVSQTLNSTYVSIIGSIAYCYAALVPLLQPIIVRLLTSNSERVIKPITNHRVISKKIKIAFPIIITIVVSVLSPDAASLIGFLMFGNLLREVGLTKLVNAASNTLSDIIMLLLGLSLSAKLTANNLISLDTLKILCIGLIAFVCNIAFGILTVKIINLFTKKKLNPIIGAAGISAFPIAARGVQKLGQKYDKQTHLLMDAISVNVSGQLCSAIIGGMLLMLRV